MRINKLAIHGVRWMSLGNTAQSGRSEMQKATYCRIPLTGNVQTGASLGTDGRAALGQGTGCKWTGDLPGCAAPNVHGHQERVPSKGVQVCTGVAGAAFPGGQSNSHTRAAFRELPSPQGIGLFL